MVGIVLGQPPGVEELMATLVLHLQDYYCCCCMWRLSKWTTARAMTLVPKRKCVENKQEDDDAAAVLVDKINERLEPRLPLNVAKPRMLLAKLQKYHYRHC
jgi:hypothetical protein